MVWTGVIGQPLASVVAGSGSNPIGATVCAEGAAAGQVCSTVTSYLPGSGGCLSGTGDTGVTGSRLECNLVEAKAKGPNFIAGQEGDSGGPVVRFVSGTSDLQVDVTGIVSAGGGDTVDCLYNLPDTCFDILYYTAMPDILNNEYPGAQLVK